MPKHTLFRRKLFISEAGEDKGTTEGHLEEERVIVSEDAIRPIDKPNGRVDEGLKHRE